MRTVVIGGTGHVGSWLVPRLSELDHEVVVVSRGEREPYRADAAWGRVETVIADRPAEEAEGTFGRRIAALAPDVVIDMISFDVTGTRQLVEALAGRVQHFLHCGSVWVHGPSQVLPTTEDRPRRPIGPYGRGKLEIEQYLHRQARLRGFPATVVHPGHISGPGWVPINPAGNVNLEVYQRLVDGRRLVLPNGGMETLQHVHADDVAGVFLAAMANRAVSIGESFHAVAATALPLRGFAELVAGWFGHQADLDFQPFDQWRLEVDAEDARITEDHLRHSPYCSMAKAGRLLGFTPAHTSAETVREALDRLIADGRLTV